MSFIYPPLMSPDYWERRDRCCGCNNTWSGSRIVYGPSPSKLRKMIEADIFPKRVVTEEDLFGGEI